MRTHLAKLHYYFDNYTQGVYFPASLAIAGVDPIVFEDLENAVQGAIDVKVDEELKNIFNALKNLVIIAALWIIAYCIVQLLLMNVDVADNAMLKSGMAAALVCSLIALGWSHAIEYRRTRNEAIDDMAQVVRSYQEYFMSKNIDLILCSSACPWEIATLTFSPRRPATEICINITQ